MKTVDSVVFLGDSITMGYGLEIPSDRYSSVFCRMSLASRTMKRWILLSDE